MMTQCNLVELFSGIGSQYKALKNLGINVHTVGTSEWDIHAIVAYDIMHSSTSIPKEIKSMNKQELLEVLCNYTFSNSGKTELEFSSLKSYSVEVLQHLLASIRRNNNYVDISKVSGLEMPDNIDILTYSFPCQDLSNVGAFHGYNKGIDKDSGSRSSLLWQVGRILSEMKSCGKSLPRYLLMENVPTLLYDRHWPNFKQWIDDLESLGYLSYYFSLNASSFGVPQNRPRLLMISVFVGQEKAVRHLVKAYFDAITSDDIVSDYQASNFYHKYSVRDLLRTDYSNRQLLDEAIECNPNDTVSRRKIWNDNPKLINENNEYDTSIDAIRTITTKQDRNPNSGNLYFDSGIPGRSKYRYLTPRECMLFMGFDELDYERLIDNNLEFHKGDALFARDKVLKLSGNSIPVKLLEGVFLQIIYVDELIRNLKEHREYINLMAEGDEINKSVIKTLYHQGIRRHRRKDERQIDKGLLYGKYNSVIYLENYYLDGSKKYLEQLPKDSRRLWKRIAEDRENRRNEEIKTFLDLGWNIIKISDYQLFAKNDDSAIKWLYSNLKKNEDLIGERGRVMNYGG